MVGFVLMLGRSSEQNSGDLVSHVARGDRVYVCMCVCMHVWLMTLSHRLVLCHERNAECSVIQGDVAQEADRIFPYFQ